MKKLIAVLFVLWGGAACGWYYYQAPDTGHPRYRTVAVGRGDLRATINATGTLEPEEVVDVGAQVAGSVQKILVDYQTHVEKGQILAQLDDALFKARVQQARANLAQAQANLATAQAKVTQAKAQVLEARAHASQAERDLERTRQLRTKGGIITQQEYDANQSTAEASRATLAVAESGVVSAESAVASAESGVAVAQANLEEAQANLGYTTITSPVDGLILDRRVNVGQTVIASLNAPSLFLIAKDLRRMQIWASVNEADIGGIREGQAVHFTVSAFPGRTFEGKVAQIRHNASMVQNVVTYTVVISVENPEQVLMPYLTARVQFQGDKREGVLLVSNAALRWRPRPADIAPESRSQVETPGDGKGLLWVRQGDFVHPVSVKIGLNDGLESEVQGEGLDEGTEVVVGVVTRDQPEEAYSILPHTKAAEKKEDR